MNHLKIKPSNLRGKKYLLYYKDWNIGEVAIGYINIDNTIELSTNVNINELRKLLNKMNKGSI